MGGCLFTRKPSDDTLNHIPSLSPTMTNLSPRPSTQTTLSMAALAAIAELNRDNVDEESVESLGYLECCPFCHSQSEPFTEFQLVILGAGYSGKTTLRHHLVQRFGHAFCRADLLMYRDILQQNVLELFRDLLRTPTLSFKQLRVMTMHSNDLSIDGHSLTGSHSENVSESTATASWHKEDAPTLSLKALLNQLGREELKYGRDSGRYLITNSRRILAPEFEPKFEDLLQCHVRSTGLMLEHHVLVRGLRVHDDDGGNAMSADGTELSDGREPVVFRVVDVGGHRNERKKWDYVLRQSNDVVVFVVSAASFCQNLFEDFKENAMRESLAVWDRKNAPYHFAFSWSPYILHSVAITSLVSAGTTAGSGGAHQTSGSPLNA